MSEGQPWIANWTARLGPGRTFLIIALGHDRVYCYADVNRAEPTDPTGDWRDLFARFAEPVPSLLAHGADAHRTTIEEVVVPRWVDRGVVLAGDAAHASSPNIAQGAAMALDLTLRLAGDRIFESNYGPLRARP